MAVDRSTNFFVALINADSFSFFPASGVTNFSFQSVVDASSPLSLTAFGYAGDASNLTDGTGRYSGTIQMQTVAAVPEPQTYALLLAGLAALGVMTSDPRVDASQPISRKLRLSLRPANALFPTG